MPSHHFPKRSIPPTIPKNYIIHLHSNKHIKLALQSLEFEFKIKNSIEHHMIKKPTNPKRPRSTAISRFIIMIQPTRFGDESKRLGGRRRGRRLPVMMLGLLALDGLARVVVARVRGRVAEALGLTVAGHDRALGARLDAVRRTGRGRAVAGTGRGTRGHDGTSTSSSGGGGGGSHTLATLTGQTAEAGLQEGRLDQHLAHHADEYHAAADDFPVVGGFRRFIRDGIATLS